MSEAPGTEGLDSEGFIIGQRHYIKTWSGLKVDPLAINPEDVSLSDIAHALARLCRYNGHTGGFLSVARHSIMVSERLEAIGRRDLTLWGLLHDASEAYLGDMTKPLKTNPAMAPYRDAEERAERSIAESFGLPYPMPPEVHEADRYVLAELELPDMREHHHGEYERDEREFLDRYDAVQWPASMGARLIGLSGYAQSGKDTVAKILGMEQYERLAFADTLREFLLALDPRVPVKVPGHHGLPMATVVHRHLSDVITERGWERAKVELPEVRALLQRLGTECGRMIIGPTVWIDATLAKVKHGTKYVFSDVRFPNEAEAIRSRGGEVWRIARPGYAAVNDHPSEHVLDGYAFDAVIDNNGTRAELRRVVLETLTR